MIIQMERKMGERRERPLGIYLITDSTDAGERETNHKKKRSVFKVL